MNRRDTLTAIAALGAAAGPLASLAQQPGRVWRIGSMGGPLSVPPGVFDPYRDKFTSEMRNLGYIEGKHFAIEGGHPKGEYERLPAVAAELVRDKVDIIIAFTSPAVSAAQKATGSIPIILIGVSDPVGSGFAASLARPGGNITGLSNIVIDLSLKRLELLRLIVPRLSRLAILVNPDNKAAAPTLNIMQAATRASGEALGIQVQPASARTAEDIERAFAFMLQERTEGVIVTPDIFFYQQRHQIIQLAKKHRIPAIFSLVKFVEDGGLMSYGNSALDDFHHLATYVDKIIKGAKPSDLPIEQPTKFQLVVSRKSAAAIGLAIPQELLLRADEVIE